MCNYLITFYFRDFMSLCIAPKLTSHIYRFIFSFHVANGIVCIKKKLIMAPVFRRDVVCPIAFNTTIDRSAAEINTQTNSSRSRDEEALWYIVVTLLFYSLGIVIGIVVYLKKEKQEIAETKMFDEFIAFNKGQSAQNNAKDRSVLVQKTIQRLREIESASFVNRSRLSSIDQIGTSQILYSSPGDSKVFSINMEREYVFSGDTDICSEDYDMSDPDDDPFPNRRLSQVVAKIFESESNIGHVSDDVTKDNETASVTTQETTDSLQRSDSAEIETDFIDYNEEPKNKALLRGLEKDKHDSNEPTKQVDNLQQHSTETSIYDAKAIDPVFESSKRRQSLLEKFAHGDLESIEEENENPTYKWSVTSV